MNIVNRRKLKKLVYKQFEIGIDRQRLISALSEFIDENYTHLDNSRNANMQQFMNDIENHSSYYRWKKDFAYYIKNELNKI
ncbi:MAG: hypothetical protein K9H26_18440 [Prolixibacteraceae bacterium]|nr:hypothetical protein [Prolixibacteraceae bacterium]